MAQYIAAAEVHLEKIRLVMKISPEKCQIGSLRDWMPPLSHHSGTNQVINIETFFFTLTMKAYFRCVFLSVWGKKVRTQRKCVHLSSTLNP